jgi:hypothetical protein
MRTVLTLIAHVVCATFAVASSSAAPFVTTAHRVVEAEVEAPGDVVSSDSTSGVFDADASDTVVDGALSQLATASQLSSIEASGFVGSGFTFYVQDGATFFTSPGDHAESRLIIFFGLSAPHALSGEVDLGTSLTPTGAPLAAGLHFSLTGPGTDIIPIGPTILDAILGPGSYILEARASIQTPSEVFAEGQFLGSSNFFFEVLLTQVPEPGVLFLLTGGAVGITACERLRRARKAPANDVRI